MYRQSYSEPPYSPSTCKYVRVLYCTRAPRTYGYCHGSWPMLNAKTAVTSVGANYPGISSLQQQPLAAFSRHSPSSSQHGSRARPQASYSYNYNLSSITVTATLHYLRPEDRLACIRAYAVLHSKANRSASGSRPVLQGVLVCSRGVTGSGVRFIQLSAQADNFHST